MRPPLSLLPSLLLVLLLPACGFTPLYGPEVGAQAQLASITLAAPQERLGQQLHWLLEDRLYGTAARASPTATLAVSITSAREDLGIRRDDVATRARRSFTASYTLTPLTGGSPISGSERAAVSYNIFTDPYATAAAEENAQSRGLEQLADQLAARLALHQTTLQRRAQP